MLKLSAGEGKVVVEVAVGKGEGGRRGRLNKRPMEVGGMLLHWGE